VDSRVIPACRLRLAMSAPQRSGRDTNRSVPRVCDKSATVRPSGPLRVNNGDAMMPALIAGTGLGILPEFIVRDALAEGRLERSLADWSLPSGAVYWVTPPGGLAPQRVKVLADALFEGLGQRMREDSDSREKASRAKR
jgi:DNA-binding transcriptional LysR family regulator